MAEKKVRCMLASEEYLQDIYYIANHYQVEDFRQGRLDDGNWEFHFKCDDRTMLDIIQHNTFRLNWQPLKIAIYYV